MCHFNNSHYFSFIVLVSSYFAAKIVIYFEISLFSCHKMLKTPSFYLFLRNLNAIKRS